MSLPSPPPGLFGVQLFSFLCCDFCSVSCHQCFLCLWFVHSRLTLYFSPTFIYMKCYEVNSRPWLGVLDTTVYDKVCQWIAEVCYFLWFNPPIKKTNRDKTKPPITYNLIFIVVESDFFLSLFVPRFTVSDYIVSIFNLFLYFWYFFY